MLEGYRPSLRFYLLLGDFFQAKRYFLKFGIVINKRPKANISKLFGMSVVRNVGSDSPGAAGWARNSHVRHRLVSSMQLSMDLICAHLSG